MNHYVPDFEIQMDDDDEEFPIPISKKPSVQNDQIMELLWQNGQVVMQSQNQRPFKKMPSAVTNTADGVIPAREIRSSVEENYSNQHLFMQEDEMASWLHYPIDDDPPFDHHEFCAGLLCPQPPPVMVSAGQNQNSSMQASVCTAVPRPPIPPARKQEKAANRIQNFAYFSKYNNARTEPGPSSSSKAAAAQSTVVDSCDTPVATAVTASRVSETVRSTPEHAETGRGSTSNAGKAGPSTAVCDMTVTSSPGCSSGSAEPSQREPVVDRKRKGLEPEESEFLSEDVDFESPEAKKQVRGSTSTKRSRAAEVHNLSERRRRDRINEKMRALQELIPRCNKSDKASMLDEAIEYLKSLQLQVQMMSMGCGMVPMMFPGIQQYMPPPMGMGIGMGMGMEMGMNRPVMPFPNMLAAGSTLPTAATAAAHLGPRFPMPPFHMPHIPTPDPSRMQPPTHSDNIRTSVGTLDPDQSRIPNFPDPYQQYLNPHQVQLQLMQAMNQQNVNKPSTSRGQENPEKHQSEET